MKAIVDRLNFAVSSDQRNDRLRNSRCATSHRMITSSASMTNAATTVALRWTASIRRNNERRRLVSRGPPAASPPGSCPAPLSDSISKGRNYAEICLSTSSINASPMVGRNIS